jgi:hypothetical protein
MGADGNTRDYQFMLARQRSVGVRQPKNNPSNDFEIVTQKSLVLYGTVNQIVTGVNNYEACVTNPTCEP